MEIYSSLRSSQNITFATELEIQFADFKHDKTKYLFYIYIYAKDNKTLKYSLIEACYDARKESIVKYVIKPMDNRDSIRGIIPCPTSFKSDYILYNDSSITYTRSEDEILILEDTTCNILQLHWLGKTPNILLALTQDNNLELIDMNKTANKMSTNFLDSSTDSLKDVIYNDKVLADLKPVDRPSFEQCLCYSTFEYTFSFIDFRTNQQVNKMNTQEVLQNISFSNNYFSCSGYNRNSIYIYDLR